MSSAMARNEWNPNQPLMCRGQKCLGAYLPPGPDSAQRSTRRALHRQIAPVPGRQTDSSLCGESAARHLTAEVRQTRIPAETRCFQMTRDRFMKPTLSSGARLIESGCVKTISATQRDQIFPQYSAGGERHSRTSLARNNFIPFLHSFVSATGSSGTARFSRSRQI